MSIMSIKKSILLYTVLFIFCVSSTSAQQSPTTSTDSPAAIRVKELVGIINSGSYVEVKKYVSENYSPEFLKLAPINQHVGLIMDLYDQSKGFEYIGIEAENENSISVRVKNPLTEGYMIISVQVEKTPPYYIAGLRFGFPPPDPISIPGRVTEGKIRHHLDTYVNKLADADIFSGTVLLAKDGRVIYKKAFGQANKDFETDNNIETKFNLGSMNKMFTAISIAQLAERGMLSFEDPLSKFLPDLLDSESSEKIKIKHLLSHTSGLGSFFTPKFFEASRDRYRTVNDFLPLVKDEKPKFEPGTGWRYSNVGMLLLGAVIEKVTDGSYFDYVREHIYKPAGMVNTDCYDLDLVNSNLAIGYEKEYNESGKQYRNNIFAHVIRGGPSGGGYSTVKDLLKFSDALLSDKLVSAQSRQMLTSPKPELSSPFYGYGFSVMGKIVGHSGGFIGVSSNMDIFLNDGYTAIVLSNYGGASIQAITERMRQLVFAASANE